MASEISNLRLVKDKDAYSVNDSITLNVKFSLSGEMRDVFNEKNWTDAYDKNDNQFKLKYGIKLVSSGLRKHDVAKPIDTYRKASIFWTRNPTTEFAGVITRHPLTNDLWMRVVSSKPLKDIVKATDTAISEATELKKLLASKIKVN